MFSSKELGHCNPRQQRKAPTSTNAGYAHGCHHTSLLVLATTRRHAICNFARDTCSPTEDHSRSSFTQSELNSLTQLSVPLQGRHRAYEDLQLATALPPAHSSTQPPALSSVWQAITLPTPQIQPY